MTQYLGNIQTPYFSKEDVQTLNTWYGILSEPVQEILWMEREPEHFATALSLCGFMSIAGERDLQAAAKAAVLFPKNGEYPVTPYNPFHFETDLLWGVQKGVRPIETLCQIAERDYPNHHETTRLRDFVDDVCAIGKYLEL